MNRLTVFGGALLCVVMLACSLPPFDEELSLAASTTSKLQTVARIGPIRTWHGDFEDGEPAFLPVKDAPESRRGFLVTASDYYLRIRYLDGAVGLFGGEARFDLPAGDPDRKTFAVQPLKGGPFLSLAVFDPANAANNGLLLFDGSLPALISSENLYNRLNGSFQTVPLNRIAGAHLYPQIDPAYDRFSFFGVLNGSGLFGEIEADADPSAPGAIGAITTVRQYMPLPSLPAPASGAFYCHRPIAPYTSYLSCYEASTGTYRNYSWDVGSAVRELSGMRRRIDALLSSGELLSFNYGVCSVYDGRGNRKYGFPTGSLRFCFEKYDAVLGAYRLYFSLVYWIYGYENDGDRLYIEVYSIPTAQLASLD